MASHPIGEALATVLGDACRIGEILVRTTDSGFVLCHREDERALELREYGDPEQALEIARYDDAGNYRPLKTAPTLRHGWSLKVTGLVELRRAIDYFYPGRLEVFLAWKAAHLVTTPLRDTLGRQSGMYRIAGTVSDDQIDNVVGNFCRSDGGCLRTILWRRDKTGAPASSKLAPIKFDPSVDQVSGTRVGGAMPLLCQEGCNLLVAECRKTVKGGAEDL